MALTVAKKTPVAAKTLTTRRDSHEVRVRTAARDGQYHLIATRTLAAGEFLMTIDGELACVPCRHSVQVGPQLHIAPPAGLTRNDAHDLYLWRFLNHSCKPNCMVVGRDLVAIAGIAVGEEVTLDYNSNEYDMAAPFRCHCGHCDGANIRGYRHLSPAERKRRQHRLAKYLREALDQTTV